MEEAAKFVITVRNVAGDKKTRTRVSPATPVEELNPMMGGATLRTKSLHQFLRAIESYLVPIEVEAFEGRGFPLLQHVGDHLRSFGSDLVVWDIEGSQIGVAAEGEGQHFDFGLD